MIIKRQNMSENQWNHFKIVPLLTQSLSTVNCQLSILRSRQIPFYRTIERYRAVPKGRAITQPGSSRLGRPPCGQFPICLSSAQNSTPKKRGRRTAPGGNQQQPQPLLVFSQIPPLPPQQQNRRSRIMIHQQLFPPKQPLLPHIEVTSDFYLSVTARSMLFRFVIIVPVPRRKTR